MIDFHTHILPKLDDGSRSTEESVAMLEELRLQGVAEAVLTPHFYANHSSPSDFFERRTAAWESLRQHYKADAPKLRLGAEVRYFDGINRYEDLDRFCIEGTQILLLEMPDGPWTKRMTLTLAELNERSGITVLLAHIERYWRCQPKEIRRELAESGIRMQLSAEHVIDRRTRREALKMLRSGTAHVLGSDCHNMTSRKPNMSEAVAIITRKLGTEFAQSICENGRLLLHDSIIQNNTAVQDAVTGGGQL